MKRVSKSKSEEAFQRALGQRIEKEILKNGYNSTYDFWVKTAGESISRSTLNYIVSGKSDVKVTSLREIAKLLGVKTSVLLDFE